MSSQVDWIAGLDRQWQGELVIVRGGLAEYSYIHLRQQHSLIPRIWCVWVVGNRKQKDAIPLSPGRSTDLNTAIVDAGASGIFFKAWAPVCNVNKDTPKIRHMFNSQESRVNRSQGLKKRKKEHSRI